jgi:hypothetical protein
MRPEFSRRAGLLGTAAVSLLLTLCWPMVSVSQKTCDRILPGMTEQEAWQAVGISPGWYDGVVGISTNAPGHKGYKPTWVGFGGEIVVDLDDSGRVTKATFYPAEVISWSFGDWLLVRVLWVHLLGWPLRQRVTAFLTITIGGVWLAGLIGIRARSANLVAEHGGIGLVLGGVVAVFMFADLSVLDLSIMFLLLMGPILGAVLGILVAFCRRSLAWCISALVRRRQIAEVVT